MKSIKYILLLFIYILGQNALFSQKDLSVVASPLIDVEELELSDSDYNKIINASKSIMKQYYKAATLIDPSVGQVSQSSINNYSALFSQGAKIINDLSERMLRDRNPKDYASQVADYLEKDGVKFEMYPASINNIIYDKAGYYKVEVVTEKELFNGLAVDKSTFTCKTGRLYFLRFMLQIEEDDLNTAKIFKIDGRIKKKCEDSKLLFGVYGRLGIGASEFQPKDNLGISSVKPSSIGGGLSVNIPLTKKELIFLSVNAALVNYKMDIDFSSNGNLPLENRVTVNDPNDFNRENFNTNIRITEAKEAAKFTTIDIPIGLMFRKKGKTNDRIAFGSYFLVVSSITTISASSTLTPGQIEFATSLDFESSEDNLEVVFGDDINDFLGYSDASNSETKIDEIGTSSSFSIRLSPFIHFALNDTKTSFLEIAADYTFGLSDFVEPTSASNNFIDALAQGTLPNNSLLSTQFDKTNISNIGIRLGYVINF